MDKQLPLECYSCGEKIDAGEEKQMGNYTLCQSCYEKNFVCEDCNKLYLLDDSEEYHDKQLCGNCYSDCMVTCEYCEDKYDPEDSGSWGGMCPSCADEHFECENCGEVFGNDDYGGEGCCQVCNDEQDHDGIKDYHSGADCGIVFHPDKQGSLHFGIELETDNYSDRENAAKQLLELSSNEDLFWLEEDASLSNGIEIISQPCTLNYHRDNFPWKEIIKVVSNNGGKSHDTQTCGLHIHFSRCYFRDHPELYSLRLIYLFERFWEPLVKFSRRTSEAIQNNANKYDRPLFNNSSKRKMRELRDRYWRYQAVNIIPHDTIEIRLFRGSLRIETILASIELVDLLIHIAKETSTKRIQTLSWSEVISKSAKKSYRYLLDYLTRLELNRDNRGD